MREVFLIPNVYHTTVIARPSKVVKSPYMADIKEPINQSSNNHSVLAHSPSLGASGMVKPGSQVIVSLKDDDKSKRKSRYTIDMVILSKTLIVGVNPYYANEIVEYMLNKKIIHDFENIVNIRKEVKVGNSRLDFVCEGKDGTKTYIEVKNVPLINDNKIAIFPDGYRKKKNDTVSERAVKHLRELSKLKQETKCDTYMVYVVQRSDAIGFSPAFTDTQYTKAFNQAMDAGVKMIAIKIKWKLNKAFFVSTLPVTIV